MSHSELEAMVGSNENIMWRGRPNKKCFILESIFNPLLPFALVWAIIDLGMLGGSIFASAGDKSMLMFMIPFLLIHMMPVWLYLGGIIFSFRRYRHTEYIVTDRGIYVSGGVFAYTCEMKPFTDLSHINIHRGIFDQWLGVGDVVSQCNHVNFNSRNSHQHAEQGIVIKDIAEYQKVFNLVRDLQTDIYSDTMYPNDLRPEANHGYKTQYMGRDNF